MEKLYKIINLNTNGTDLYMNPRCGYKSWNCTNHTYLDTN